MSRGARYVMWLQNPRPLLFPDFYLVIGVKIYCKRWTFICWQLHIIFMHIQCIRMNDLWSTDLSFYSLCVLFGCYKAEHCSSHHMVVKYIFPLSLQVFSSLIIAPLLQDIFGRKVLILYHLCSSNSISRNKNTIIVQQWCRDLA